MTARPRLHPLEERTVPTFVVSTTADRGEGSLRQALIRANLNGPEHDEIRFAIPGAGPHTVTLASPLPELASGVTIDGYTQPGSSPNTLATGSDAVIQVEIDGGGTAHLLTDFETSFEQPMDGNRVTVRGLSVVNFSRSAIYWRALTAGTTVVEGNFLGLRPDGVTPRGNGWGVYFDANASGGSHRVGGTDPEARNLISGHSAAGVRLNDAPAVVQGNLIGTDRTGTLARPNVNGVEVTGGGHRIGGTALGAGNLVSGNTRHGVVLTGTSFEPVEANTRIEGNRIGTDAAGAVRLGNGANGVAIFSATGVNTVGGTDPAARNLISGNGSSGVYVEQNADGQEVRGNWIGTDATGTRAVPNDQFGVFSEGDALVSGNLVSGNAAGGLRLGARDRAVNNLVGLSVTGGPLGNKGFGVVVGGGPATVGGPDGGNVVAYNRAGGIGVNERVTGVTVSGNSVYANDGPGLALAGTQANNEQDPPVLAAVRVAADRAVVRGSQAGAAGVYVVEFFASPDAAGQGRTFLGRQEVTVGTDGVAGFAADLSLPPAAGTAITATATRVRTGDTSAFSAPVADPVTPTPVTPTPVTPTPVTPTPVNPVPVTSTPVVPVTPGVTPTAPAVGPARQFSIGEATGVSLFNPDGSGRGGVTPFGGFAGGVRTAAADFTGDGLADVVAGTGPGRATQVVVFNGATGAELFRTDPFEASFTGGVFVAAGDLTGDGLAELVISPDEGGGPRVRVFNGAGFGQLADFFGIDDPNFRGGARAGVGDVTGDGRGDLLVAAGFGGGPRVAAFDGTSLANGAYTRKPFADFFAFEPALRNGVYLTAGDLTGDGTAELIAGAGPGGGPRVTAFDGRDLMANTQTRVSDFFAGDPNNRDGVRVAVKDLDGDRRADLVTGAGSGGRVTAYAGTALAAGGSPAELFGLDAGGGLGGVFVG